MKSREQITYRNWIHSKRILSCLLVFFIASTFASLAQEDKRITKKAEREHAEAQRATKKGDFYQAEAKYRKAISSNPDKMDSRYNLGSTYYDKEQYKESLMRFEEAARLAEDKEAKHAAFHNLGNAYMKDQQYRQAEQAFKEALRNNPADEETRYNYAIAKELAKDEPEPPSEDSDTPEDQPDEDEDQGDDDDQDPEQDDGDQEEEQGEEQEQDGDPEDEDAEGEKDQQEVPQDGKLSPEQMENLLNAMDNAEKDLQKKLEEQKEKGKELNKEKYW